VAAKIGNADDRTDKSKRRLPARNGTVELVSVGAATSFSVWAVKRIARHRWRHHKIVFQSNDSSIISQWVDKINEILLRTGINSTIGCCVTGLCNDIVALLQLAQFVYVRGDGGLCQSLL
jgi:hypothetical protein